MAGLRHSFWLRAHLAAVLPWAALMNEHRPFGGFADLAGDALYSYVMAVIAGAAAAAALASMGGLWSRWWRGPVPSPEEFAMPTPVAGTPRRGGGSGAVGRAKIGSSPRVRGTACYSDSGSAGSLGCVPFNPGHHFGGSPLTTVTLGRLARFLMLLSVAS